MKLHNDLCKALFYPQPGHIYAGDKIMWIKDCLPIRILLNYTKKSIKYLFLLFRSLVYLLSNVGTNIPRRFRAIFLGQINY